MEKPKYTLITGRLARKSLERVLNSLSSENLEIRELDCSVAALMSTEFIAKNLVPFHSKNTEILIPGLCQGSLQPIMDVTGCHVQRGPDNLWDLPMFFKAEMRELSTAGDGTQQTLSTDSEMQIVAEIVNASRLNMKEIQEKAAYFRDSGADIIDLGGNVEGSFPRLKEVIRELKTEGFKVSVDSHLKEDILAASDAGAELILSLNSHNLELAKVLNCPVVVIPDDGESLDSLYRNIDQLECWNVSYLVDPILPPPCLGMAAGIARYAKVRYDFPDCLLFMGIGNVTEMIDADSVGGNAFLTAIASELSIQYVLTTEVSFRAIGAVKEIALARTLMHKALSQGRVPKHIDDRLLVMKESSASSYSEEDLRQMQRLVQDQSYRIFAADDIYCFNNNIFVQGKSAKEVFSQLDVQDWSHAFYLGQELERAETALLLNKKYVQDNPLRWGYLNGS